MIIFIFQKQILMNTITFFLLVINYFNSYMQKSSLLLLISILFVVSCLSKVHPEAKLPFLDYCRYFNYPAQAHEITTQDGYILKVFRIQKKGSQIKQGLKPMLLQHGLLDSSDTWLINDEDKAPGFIFANAGFDVWLGNSRGNKHSRRHVSLNPDKNASFWQFSFQHMADYDLPAVFKYINSKTHQKLHYFGHSQGTIQMHIALSKQNPVIESLIDKYFGLGPVAYITHQESNLVNLLDKSLLLQWYHLRHIHQFMPSMSWFQTDVGMVFCADFAYVCADLLKYVMDADPSLDNYDRYDVLVGHDPSGTSVQNMAHWKQMLDKKSFIAYDYGTAKENIAHYNQSTPPKFNLTNIRIPIRLFAGTSDLLADVTDVNQLWAELNPPYKEFYRIYNAGHCTFIWGKDLKPWMTDINSMLYKNAIDEEEQQNEGKMLRVIQ